jgi:hypothetical protein
VRRITGARNKMREITARSFFCPKVNQTVYLVEYARADCGHDVSCGILSCSHQELCAEINEKGERVYPWSTCPACRDRSRDAVSNR